MRSPPPPRHAQAVANRWTTFIRIDWASLRHAYGAATEDRPRTSALLSPSVDERCAAREEFFLRSSILHQGSVYTASTAAWPFLCDVLVATPDQELREHLLAILTGLATGFGYDTRHSKLDGAPRPAILSAEESNCLDAREAVRRRLPDTVSLLASAAPLIRGRAVIRMRPFATDCPPGPCAWRSPASRTSACSSASCSRSRRSESGFASRAAVRPRFVRRRARFGSKRSVRARSPRIDWFDCSKQSSPQKTKLPQSFSPIEVADHCRPPAS